MTDHVHASASYRVSPYLQDVAFDPSDYGVRTPCRMLYDHLHHRHTLVSLAVYESLADARADNRAFSSAEIAAFGDEGDLLVSASVVLPAEETFRVHHYSSIEIEINRHCNFRCTFCPVSVAPKPGALMDEATYRKVLDRVVEYGALIVSLNHYSEPTLHPRFVEYCELARARGLHIRLHTNASVLDETKIERLRPLNQHMWIVVNLPTVDERAFAEETGARLFPRVMRNLELLHDSGFKVMLSVNTPRTGADDVLEAINSRLGHMFGTQVQWPTDDRAGGIEQPAYAQAVHHTGRLTGCHIATRQINVSYKGEVFLCCQDFHQNYVVGNILEEPLKKIVEGEAMIALRRTIFGGEPTTASFICARCTKTYSLSSKPKGFFYADSIGPMSVMRGRPIQSVLVWNAEPPAAGAGA